VVETQGQTMLAKPAPIVTSPTKTQIQNFPIFKNRIYQTYHICRGFEQLSSSTSWRVLGDQTWANRGSKRVEKTCIDDNHWLLKNV